MNDEPETIEPPTPPPDDQPSALAIFLEQHGGNCPVCDYSLQSLHSDLCPECGAPIELTLNSPQRKIGPWITGLISLAMVGGFCMLFIVFIIIGTILYGPPPGEVTAVMVGAGVIGAAELVCLRIWTRQRFKFWQRNAEQQKARAIAAVTLSVVPLILLYILIFGVM